MHNNILERIFLYIFESFLFIWMVGPLRIAVAASAVVAVTATVIKPAIPDQAISVLPANLDMTGKISDELTINNHSADWHEIRIELLPLAENNSEECKLLYSPSLSNIAPHTTQVVRIFLRKRSETTCQINHKLIITDSKAPGFKVIEVPLSSTLMVE